MLGTGSAAGALTEPDVRRIAAEFVERERLAGRRVLAVIPDQTRSGPIDLMFRVLYDLLAPRAGGKGALDFLIALGTHPPMSEQAIDARLALAPGERAAKYPRTRVFNHDWKDPRQLTTIGTIPRERVEALSGGMMHEPVPVTVNRMVLDYDVVLIVGPTFPHEVVGFSGGNKYLFPGIAGAEIIDMFHWLGALVTSPVIIGRKRTPTRAVVDEAAQLLPVPRLCMSLVVRGDAIWRACSAGPPRRRGRRPRTCRTGSTSSTRTGPSRASSRARRRCTTRYGWAGSARTSSSRWSPTAAS